MQFEVLSSPAYDDGNDVGIDGASGNDAIMIYFRRFMEDKRSAFVPSTKAVAMGWMGSDKKKIGAKPKFRCLLSKNRRTTKNVEF